MVEALWQREARRVGKVFACFSHQVRQGLDPREGHGPFVVRAEDALLQIRPGPDMPLLSIRPHFVKGAVGVECFMHCSEASPRDGTPQRLVAVYRYGITGRVRRHSSDDGSNLGVLSDSYVAVGIARTLIAEAQGRFGRQSGARRSQVAQGADPAEGMHRS